MILLDTHINLVKQEQERIDVSPLRGEEMKLRFN